MDYLNPDYTEVFSDRARRLKRLREDPRYVAACQRHYATHPWDFVSDWGLTFDPRGLAAGRLSLVPFVLWAKQAEYLKWIYAKWRNQERGLVEKSRDCGVTWLSVGFAVAMWLFVDGFTVGFGSRKEDLVHKRGDPDSIFEKITIFLDNLPLELLPEGFNQDKHIAHMRVTHPTNAASITGEAGDQIGRGGRKSIYFVDEAAFVEHQALVDRALSQNTNCQIDISTPNGNGNVFYSKRMRFDKTDRVFIFDWRDDPRKDQAWYDKQVAEQDSVTVAQEIDRDYNASQEDMFIPAKWVTAAVDAHKLLGFEPEGLRVTGFDPADVGDARAVVNRHGSVLLQAEQKLQGDISDAIPWAFNLADGFRADVFVYDGDGMGAPSMKVALKDKAVTRMKVIATHAQVAPDGNKVFEPDEKYSPPGTRLKDEDLKKNKDTFQDYRAQKWTWARDRFERTYEAVTRAKKGLLVNVDPDHLVSIDSSCTQLNQLKAELSRPMRIFTNNGKIRVESKAEMKKREVDSPNLADATIEALSVRRPKERKKRTTRDTTARGGQGWMAG